MAARNSLIIFTPRSGSTIIGDLLAYKNNAINLDEIITGSMRYPFQEKLPDDVNKIIRDKDFVNKATALMEEQHSKDAPTYWNNMFSFYQERMEFLRDVTKAHNVVVKYYPIVALPGVKLIEWAVQNDFDIIFSYRKNFEEQLYSLVLADVKERFYKNLYKSGKLTMYKNAGYLNIKGSRKIVFPPVYYSRPQALQVIVKLTNIRTLYNTYINQFGMYGKVVCYEDTIAKNDFSSIGITAEEYAAYQIKDKSLRPTYDYEIGKQITNWEEVLEIASHYNIESTLKLNI